LWYVKMAVAPTNGPAATARLLWAHSHFVFEQWQARALHGAGLKAFGPHIQFIEPALIATQAARGPHGGAHGSAQRAMPVQ
jgi:hypothetical protein